MFRKASGSHKYLSKNEMKQALALRDVYVKAFEMRSLNADSFDHNLECLRQLDIVLGNLLQLLQDSLNKVDADADHKMKLNFTKKGDHVSVKSSMINMDGEVQCLAQTDLMKMKWGEAISIILDGEANKRISASFCNASDKRVIRLCAHEKFKDTETSYSSGKVKKTHSQYHKYKMVFSDNSVYKFDSLHDENKLVAARDYFETKMQELSLVRPSLR